ncbi:hypothetical protein ACEWY4_018898 [Coilia grayii]|uniref:C-type lectin domain-containing protein n=1 Tax=Coilia grayii TaxID=363190 RepID=A0ABD1JHU1_9TELE
MEQSEREVAEGELLLLCTSSPILSGILSETLSSTDETAVGVQAWAPRPTACESGWTLHENRCFRFFNLPRTCTLAEGNTWYWTDGDPFDYTNWHAWEPNNAGGNEHRINTNFADGGVWNDLSCNQELPFVCVK